MKNAEAQATTARTSDSKTTDSNALNPLFDALALSLIVCNAYFGMRIWESSLSTVDRVIGLVCVALGCLLSIRDSLQSSVHAASRFFLIGLLLSAAGLLITVGVLIGSSFLLGLAACATLTGWCMARLRGETIAHSIAVGLVLSILLLVEPIFRLGYFDAMTTASATMTSLLADLALQPNVRVGDQVLFKELTADHFSCIGTWDGLLSYLGIGLFCILGFRRGLVHASFLLSVCIMVWPAIRSVAWVAMSLFASGNQVNGVWTFLFESALFLMGVAMIFSSDQLLGAILKPIPFDRFRSKAPLFAYVWNWSCGFASPILRGSNENKVSRRRRSSLSNSKSGSKFWRDWKWFWGQLLGLLIKPMQTVGYGMDTVRGWRSSRSWKKIIFHTPPFAILVIVYMALAISASNRNDSQPLLLSRESIDVCSTETLESACYELHEQDFALAIGGTTSEFSDKPTVTISESTKRYVELLSKRVLSIEPNNHVARYRLGMILDLNLDIDGAEGQMQAASSSKLSEFPQADSWLAKNEIIRKANGNFISEEELQRHLLKASRLSDCDFRLLFLYSSLLETNGELQQAVEIAKKAVAVRPQSILDLARLYVRIGDERGRLIASKTADAYFTSKIRTDDNESSRLAIADARLLRNQLTEAKDVLSEGLRKGVGGSRLKRQLSEIQRTIYSQSFRKNDQDIVEVNLSLLENAIDSDCSNPNISSEIAKLLAIKTKPTKKLLEALQHQIDSGIASVTCRLLLGEKFFSIGKLAEARVHLEAALSMDPNNVTALNNLATCLATISPANLDRSIELISLADSLSPNNADILDTWGEVSMIANRPQEAVNKYERAIRHDAKRIDIRKKLIAAYEAAGLIEMARTQLKVVHNLEAIASQKK